MLRTVEVQPLSDTACERILSEQNGEETQQVTTETEVVQAGTDTTFDKVRDIVRQDWFPWAVAGGFFILWATKRKERS